jgi:hypothetical protein
MARVAAVGFLLYRCAERVRFADPLQRFLDHNAPSMQHRAVVHGLRRRSPGPFAIGRMTLWRIPVGHRCTKAACGRRETVEASSVRKPGATRTTYIAAANRMLPNAYAMNFLVVIYLLSQWRLLLEDPIAEARRRSRLRHFFTLLFIPALESLQQLQRVHLNQDVALTG